MTAKKKSKKELAAEKRAAELYALAGYAINRLQRALDALPDTTDRAVNLAIDAARDVLTHAHYLQSELKEAEEKIEELDGKVTTLEDKLSDHEYAIADAAYAVCELAPKVLGHESCHVDEALPVFELRRAIEDLKGAIP